MWRKENDMFVGLQLYNAAQNGNVEELRRLIDGGADVNATNVWVSVYVLCMCQL
jgi:hypothetical protein